jgi:hypothetical protein
MWSVLDATIVAMLTRLVLAAASLVFRRTLRDWCYSLELVCAMA